MSQVQLQRQGSNQQERQRGQQRQTVSRLHRLDLKDPFQRCQNECSSYEPGKKWIEHDQYAPLQFHFVGVHESFYWNLHKSLLIALNHPDRNRSTSNASPFAVSKPARCASAGIHGSDHSDSLDWRAVVHRWDRPRNMRSSGPW